MLSALEKTEWNLVFLGDIMDLWIGLSGFQEPWQGEFLEWCRRESARRRILFLEGNHEFFVVQPHGGYFSAAGGDLLQEDGLLLTHGDQVAAAPSHLRFRRWSKGGLARLLLRFLPGARGIVRLLKRRFEQLSQRHPHRFPAQALVAWGKERLLPPGAPRALLMGHFHHFFQHRFPNGALLAALPAWKDRGEVGLYYPQENQLLVRNWRSLPSLIPPPPKNPPPTPKNNHGHKHAP